MAPSATSHHQRNLGMTAVGFEPTQLALVELESTPLDHSGKLSLHVWQTKSSTDNKNTFLNKGRRKREIELPHQCRRRHQLASTQSRTNTRIQTNAHTGARTSPAHSSSREYSRAKHITRLSTSCDSNRNRKHTEVTLKANYSANPAKARAWIVWLLPHPREAHPPHAYCE